MILQRSTYGPSVSRLSTEDTKEGDHRSDKLKGLDSSIDTKSTTIPDEAKPLSCMFYFFASHMKQNIQDADPELVKRRRMPDVPTHKFDSMLNRVGMHAAFSPHVKTFQTYPVDIVEGPGMFTKHNPRPPRGQLHDTMLLMEFKTKHDREQWLATKEWQHFYKTTESEQVFRRMPHVRCASSIRGLMDPIDVLTA